MKSPLPPSLPSLFLWVQQAWIRQSTRDRDNKMQLEPQQKEASSTAVERGGVVEEKLRRTSKKTYSHKSANTSDQEIYRR